MRFAVIFPDIIGHFCQRGAGKKYLVDPFAFHDPRILGGNCPAAPAKDCDLAGALTSQLPDDLGEKIDVSAIVTRDPDCGHILLDGGANNIAGVTVETEIYHLDAVTNKLEVDGVDCAVVPVADWDRCENANG